MHILEDRSKKLPEEMRKLVKSQDMKYVAHARSIDKKVAHIYILHLRATKR